MTTLSDDLHEPVRSELRCGDARKSLTHASRFIELTYLAIMLYGEFSGAALTAFRKDFREENC